MVVHNDDTLQQDHTQARSHWSTATHLVVVQADAALQTEQPRITWNHQPIFNKGMVRAQAVLGSLSHVTHRVNAKHIPVADHVI